jgi:hypothetical protein
MANQATLYKLPIPLNGRDNLLFTSATQRDQWLETLPQTVVNLAEPAMRGRGLRFAGNYIDLDEYDLIKVDYTNSTATFTETTFYRVESWQAISQDVSMPMMELDHILTTLPRVLEADVVEQMQTMRRTIANAEDGWSYGQADGDTAGNVIYDDSTRLTSTMDTFNLVAVYLTASSVFANLPKTPQVMRYYFGEGSSGGGIIEHTLDFPMVLTTMQYLPIFLAAERPENVVSVLQIPNDFLQTSAARNYFTTNPGRAVAFNSTVAPTEFSGEFSRFVNSTLGSTDYSTVMLAAQPNENIPMVMNQYPYRKIVFHSGSRVDFSFEDFGNPYIAEFAHIVFPEPNAEAYIPLNYRGNVWDFNSAVVFDRTRVVSYVKDYQNTLAYKQQNQLLALSDQTARSQAEAQIAGNRAQAAIASGLAESQYAAVRAEGALATSDYSRNSNRLRSELSANLSANSNAQYQNMVNYTSPLSAITSFGGSVAAGLAQEGQLKTERSFMMLNNTYDKAQLKSQYDAGVISRTLQNAQIAAGKASAIQTALTGNTLAALQRDSQIAANAINRKFLAEQPDTPVVGSGTAFACIAIKPSWTLERVLSATDNIPNATLFEQEFYGYYSAFGVSLNRYEYDLSDLLSIKDDKQFTFYQGEIIDFDREAARAAKIRTDDLLALSGALSAGVRLYTTATLNNFGNPRVNLPAPTTIL